MACLFVLSQCQCCSKFLLPVVDSKDGPCLQGLRDTTLQRDGLQRMPVMCGIGNATFLNDINEAEVAQAASFVARLHKEQAHASRPTHESLSMGNTISPFGKSLPKSIQQIINKVPVEV